MTVRATESRLPAGFEAADLGEAAVVVGSTGSADYALVSYLAGPLAEGFTIDYVVFVTNGVDVTSYEWKAELIGENDIETEMTDVGMFNYVPVGPGLLQITVTLWLASGPTVTLSLFQEVRPLFTGFEFFFESGGLGAQLDPDYSIAALGSDPRATAELTNTLRSDILAAAAAHQLPPRLLGAVAYLGSTDAPKHDRTPYTSWTPGRDQKLEWAAGDLNGGLLEGGVLHDLDDPLGVCQLTLPRLATIVGPTGVDGNPYTTWREKAADGSDASEIDDLVWSDFDALTTDEKIDLFNLARFPRTNIGLCAALLAALRDRPNRWPGLNADQLIAEPLAIETLASELDDGPNDGSQPTPQRALGESPTTGWGRTVVTHTSLPIVAVLFPDSLQDGAGDYGGRDLQRGDNDADVLQLQQDLVELGFAVIGNPDSDFGRFTEWGVREFQIYAKSRFLAVQARNGPRHLANLDQALNLYPYTGPISGVVNVGTRILIHLWKVKSWRCPVVVEAWNTDLATLNNSNTVPSRTVPAANFGNVWRREEPATADDPAEADSRLMFVRDFTGQYNFSAGRVQNFADPDHLIDVGCNFFWFGSRGPVIRCGSKSFGQAVYPSVWAEAEVLPDNLIGATLGALTDEQLATFKVVRAVAEVECLGFFDSVNCWDTAFVSLGPSHWTLALQGNPTVEEGELCGFLAYLADFKASASFEAFERFGLRVGERWIDATGDRSGGDLFNQDQRKYTSRVALQGEDGSYTMRQLSNDDSDYFRNWHWHYRWVMAGRTIDEFRKGMWDMVRIRLRDILSTPFPAAAGIPDVPDGNGGTRAATIGDCFTSETADAMLLRWHIYQPFDVCSGGLAGPRVTEAVRRAGLPGTAGDPSTWTQAHEDDLITKLEAEVANTNLSPANKDLLTDNLTWIRDWPNSADRAIRNYALDPTIGAISADRDSFRPNFDQSGLPPAPV